MFRRLVEADGGTFVQVTRITPRRGPPIPVFNFEVDGQHVYSVGPDGLLVHNGCAKFGSAAFGNEVHAGFDKYLLSMFGRLPDTLRTLPGMTGVDASFTSAIRMRDVYGKYFGAFNHAELKPASLSGFSSFVAQLDKWRSNGMVGGVALFMYDASKMTKFVGIF